MHTERDTFPLHFPTKNTFIFFYCLIELGKPHSILPWQRWEDILAVFLSSCGNFEFTAIKKKKKKDKLEDIAKQLCGIILRQFKAAIPSVKPRMSLIVILHGSVYIHYYSTKSAFTSIVLLFVFLCFSG